MKLNYFKDILFDLINDWDREVLDVFVSDKDDLLWVVMGDGSVFRLHVAKESYHLYKTPEDGPASNS